jgi:hypothetical protein
MPAPPVSPNDLTRQQLDELDALLQRMLSLPLNKPAEPAPAPRLPDPPLPEIPRVRTDPPAPLRPPHLTFPPRPDPTVVTATVPAATVAEIRSFTPPAPKPFEFPSPERLFGPPTNEPAFAAEPAPVPTPFAVPPTVEDDPEPVALAPIPDSVAVPVEPSRVPVSHWPLVGVNWVLEKTLGLFGPPGQALCTPAGKTVLGWGGVLLLLGAGVWTARGLGWVHIDWPR